jgi:hypothetical protein
MVIEDQICAKLSNEFATLGRTGRAKNLNARTACKLHRSRAHASARAVHQQCFTAAHIAAVEHCTIRGRVRNSQRGALSKAPCFRQRVNLIERANGSFRVGSREGP